MREFPEIRFLTLSRTWLLHRYLGSRTASYRSIRKCRVDEFPTKLNRGVGSGLRELLAPGDSNAEGDARGEGVPLQQEVNMITAHRHVGVKADTKQRVNCVDASLKLGAE